MKRIAILLVLISLVGFGVAQTRTSTKYVIGVNGLTCPFCAYGLEKKLKKVKGVETVSIDLEKDEAVVVIKAGATVEEESLRKAVRGAGFSVDSLKRVEPEAQVRSPGPGSAKKGAQK